MTQKIKKISMYSNPREVMYMRHRERVHKMSAYIDSASPILHAGNYLRLRKLKEDADYYNRILKQNFDLLIQMNSVARTKGNIDSFPKPICMMQHSTLGYKSKQLLAIEQANMKYGRRILCCKAELKTRRPLSAEEKERRTQQRLIFEPPYEILNKYEGTTLQLPDDLRLLRKFMRPRIYFVIAVRSRLSVRPIGRIVIELYTEACPQVVLEFVRFCKKQNLDRLHMMRLFPALWLEGELEFHDQRLGAGGQRIEYDMRALDHGSSAGILSFSRRYLRGFRNGCINFAISFRPLVVLNGKRVGFGCVREGQKLLDCLREYGTKNGKPVADIIVTSCGML